MAEYAFAAQVLARNLNACWPSSQTWPFDLVVACASRTHRVQIKATDGPGPAFQVSTKRKLRGKEIAYTSKEIDLIAVYLARRELWYILPVQAVRGTGIYLRPENPKCPYAKYKEAWSLLEK